MNDIAVFCPHKVRRNSWCNKLLTRYQLSFCISGKLLLWSSFIQRNIWIFTPAGFRIYRKSNTDLADKLDLKKRKGICVAFNDWTYVSFRNLSLILVENLYFTLLCIYVKVKVSLSQSQLWGPSLFCHVIFKECHIFVNAFYNTRQHYEYKVF